MEEYVYSMARLKTNRKGGSGGSILLQARKAKVALHSEEWRYVLDAAAAQVGQPLVPGLGRAKLKRRSTYTETGQTSSRTAIAVPGPG